MTAEAFHPPQQPVRTEMDAAKIEQIADRTRLDPASLDGAVEFSIHDQNITFEPRTLEPMGENGPIALIGVGNSLAKLYAFDISEEGKTKKMYAIAEAQYENDLVSDHAQAEGVRFINRPTTFGRGSAGSVSLGFRGDRTVSGAHFDIEADNYQILITDKSKNGTRIIVKEKLHTPKEAVSIVRAKNFGRVVIPDNIEQPKQ